MNKVFILLVSFCLICFGCGSKNTQENIPKKQSLSQAPVATSSSNETKKPINEQAILEQRIKAENKFRAKGDAELGDIRAGLTIRASHKLTDKNKELLIPNGEPNFVAIECLENVINERMGKIVKSKGYNQNPLYIGVCEFATLEAEDFIKYIALRNGAKDVWFIAPPNSWSVLDSQTVSKQYNYEFHGENYLVATAQWGYKDKNGKTYNKLVDTFIAHLDGSLIGFRSGFQTKLIPINNNYQK